MKKELPNKEYGHLIKKCFRIQEAIQKSIGDKWEMDFPMYPALKLSKLKKNFLLLLEEGTITQNEYDAILSEETINKLRYPYHNEFITMMDIDNDIVFKDYISAIISYIIGIRIPGICNESAWKNAKRFVEDNLHITTHQLLDIYEEFPIDIFVANNYRKVVRSRMRPKYNSWPVPVIVKTIHEGEDDYSSSTLDLEMIDFYWDEYNVTVDDIVEKKDAIINKYDKDYLNGNKGRGYFDKELSSYYCSIEDILRGLLNYEFSAEELNYSKTLSPEGEKYKLTVLERKPLKWVDPDPYWEGLPEEDWRYKPNNE